jgi:hypothetical protein
LGGDQKARHGSHTRGGEIGGTMDQTKQPKIKPVIDHGDLQALWHQAPRHTGGTTVRSRRTRERGAIKSTDGRRRRSTNRDRQFNTNVTDEIFDMVSDLCERFDLTKAEFVERAFTRFAEALKSGKADEVDG